MSNDKSYTTIGQYSSSERANLGSSFDSSVKPNFNGPNNSSSHLRTNPLFKEVDNELRKLRNQFDLMKPESMQSQAAKPDTQNLNSSATSI